MFGSNPAISIPVEKKWLGYDFLHHPISCNDLVFPFLYPIRQRLGQKNFFNLCWIENYKFVFLWIFMKF